MDRFQHVEGFPAIREFHVISTVQTERGECPLLNLPGELRNRIYDHVLDENKFRVLRKPKILKSKDHIFKTSLWSSPGLGLTQVCRSIRSEFLPSYRAVTLGNVVPQELYEYIDTFLREPGKKNEEVIGSVIIDFWANISSSLDIKPLLRLLRRATNLHVGTYDIIQPEGFVVAGRTPVPDVQDILTSLYDVVDLEAFYNYVERAIIALEVESDETKGVEIVFELGADYWEEWMGVWSKPDHDPSYRIPLELGDKVVQWGRGCGMELDRAAGSHLTVNFRRGLQALPAPVG
ncbi:uncharacterized protein N0V89_006593 [Didymosphaeria variabile]|uniref:F-box domain-containing protein n=1 Tax=Didymosphaeria variabile TaxID=1932322 RepID=A0A9W8XHW7_9PLEO|nr:uncharacterized protein N0V89_006593 [Didymosphaeria variabile]KAJ4351254.1 hypothetical protein N0V89_006593 [Didymosphaeria variabile]